MRTSYNPFKGIVETTTHPLSRFWRTTFWEKFLDTIRVFSGYNYNDSDRQFREHYDYRVGILDYCTLMIPMLMRRLYKEALKRKNRNTLAFFSMPILYLVHGSFSTIKFISSLIWTSAISLFVGAVHLVFRSEGNRLRRDAESITVDSETEETLGSVLNGRSLRHVSHCDISRSFSNVDLTFKINGINANDGSSVERKQVDQLSVDSNNRRQIDSLFKLNVGGVTRVLEEVNDFSFFRYYSSELRTMTQLGHSHSSENVTPDDLRPSGNTSDDPRTGWNTL